MRCRPGGVSAVQTATPASLPRRTRQGPGEAQRLLVITYNFPPDGFVGGLRWAGITKYLARLGWKVTVVTAAPPVDDAAVAGSEVERCKRLWTLADGVRWLRRSNGQSHASVADAVGAGGSPHWSSPLLSLCREVSALATFPDESRGWVFRAALRARSVMRRFHPTVVVSSGPPHSAHLVAGVATARAATRPLIDLRDPRGGAPHEAQAARARRRASRVLTLLS